MYCAVHLCMDVVGRVRSDPRIVVCLHFANRPSPLPGSCDTFTATLYIVHMICDNDGFVKYILFRVIVGIYFLDRSWQSYDVPIFRMLHYVTSSNHPGTSFTLRACSCKLWFWSVNGLVIIIILLRILEAVTIKFSFIHDYFLHQ